MAKNVTTVGTNGKKILDNETVSDAEALRLENSVFDEKSDVAIAHIREA